MNSLRGYKVLRMENIDDAYGRSACSPYPVYYGFNRWIGPRQACGALCVFDTLESAQSFCKDSGRFNSGLTIHECEYKRARKDSGVSCLFPLTGKRTIVKKQDLPSGTVLASEVKILE